MTIDRNDFGIKTESRGARWVAWLTRDGSDKPLDSVLLCGQTRDEAESNARAWADKLVADPVLIRSSGRSRGVGAQPSLRTKA